jgi:hypothetical protein
LSSISDSLSDSIQTSDISSTKPLENSASQSQSTPDSNNQTSVTEGSLVVNSALLTASYLIFNAETRIRTADALSQSQTSALSPTVVYIISGLSGVALLLFVILIFYVVFNKKRIVTTTVSYSRPTLNFSGTYSNDHSSANNTRSSLNTATQTFAEEALSVPAYLEVPETSFRILTKLGGGGGGEIFLADAMFDQIKLYGTPIVVKRMKTSGGSDERRERDRKLFEQELSIMALLRNGEHIAKIVGFSRGQYHSILMKYYPIGSLDRFLRQKPTQLSKHVAVIFALDIASGIWEMHKRDLAHCDIKPANILIETDNEGFATCVLTDFGITQVLSLSLAINGFNVANVRGLSYGYCAPEAHRRQKSNSPIGDRPYVFKAGDVYSFGSVIYEILNRKEPWQVRKIS